VIAFEEGEPRSSLLPEEEVMTLDWTPQRKAQFALGRSCARRAMRQLGIAEQAILFDDDGAPIWPERTVGSISHKRQSALVAVGLSTMFSGIGIDVEIVSGSEQATLESECASEAERSQAADLTGRYGAAGVVFLAAKEAYYKFQFPLRRAFLRWTDVSVTFAGNEFTVELAGGVQECQGVVIGVFPWLAALVTNRLKTKA
jgi:enterobactin synthetase component D